MKKQNTKQKFTKYITQLSEIQFWAITMQIYPRELIEQHLIDNLSDKSMETIMRQ